MKPSPALCARISFTTKEVGKGFYRGTRTGSMGAHTEYGGYVVDWRKVRNYNAPDLTDFKLTPFITNEMKPTKAELYFTNPETGEEETRIPKRVDAMDFLNTWKQQNPAEYDQLLRYQVTQREEKQNKLFEEVTSNIGEQLAKAEVEQEKASLRAEKKVQSKSNAQRRKLT